MNDWKPATEAEAAMRDALRANDQELYFQILSRIDLLLPAPVDLPGAQPTGWGTWTDGGRTHVLAFTSVEAVRACLRGNAGATWRTSYRELAIQWPNPQWWLAVNPGLPIEGYLPAWFVAQLVRGDVRIPGRTMGARARLARMTRDDVVGRVPEPAPAPTHSPAPADPLAPPPVMPVRPAPVPPAVSSPSFGYAEQSRSGAAARPVTEVAEPAPARRPASPFAAPPADRIPGPRASEHGPARDMTYRDVGQFHSPPPPLRPPPANPVQPPAPVQPDPPVTVAPARPDPPVTVAPARPDPAMPPLEPTELTPPPPATAPRPAPGPRPLIIEGAVVDERVTPEPATARPDVPPWSAGGQYGAAPRRPADPGPVNGWSTEAAPLLNERSTSPVAPPTEPWSPYGRPEPPPAAPEPAAPVRPIATATAAESAAPVRPVESAAFAAPTAPAESFHQAAPAVPVEPAAPAESAAFAAPTAPAESFHQAVPAEPAAFVAPTAPAVRTVPTVSTEPVDRAAEPPLLGSRSSIGPADTSQAAGGGPAASPGTPAFVPANDVEESLYTAAAEGSTDTYLSTLLLARVLLPVAPESAPDARPGDHRFVWRTETIDGVSYVVVFTSPERRAEHLAESVPTIEVKLVQLIRRWPATDWSFAVNPGSPVGARLPGEQIVALANWAAEVGLGDDDLAEPAGPAGDPDAGADEPADAPEPAPAAPSAPEDPTQPVLMQKVISPGQLRFYLERGYDRVAGFVQRASEVVHLRTPAELYTALGLGHPGSPFSPDAELIYALRWPAHRPNLYRIPYGGQNEAAMRAMQGWMIERPPYRGNGFAPGDSSDVVAEFKVDSARLPHGAQLWRLGRDGSERLVATLDADLPAWTPVVPS